MKHTTLSVGELLGSSELLAEHTAGIRLHTWQRAVGARLASCAIPTQRDGATLTVTVPSSAWAQELSLLSGMVLERLQAEGHRLTRLRFRVEPRESRRTPTQPTVRVAREPLSAALLEQLGRVQDTELRASLTQAAAFSLGRQKR